jgi:hypothetical protein
VHARHAAGPRTQLWSLQEEEERIRLGFDFKTSLTLVNTSAKRHSDLLIRV